MSQEARLACVGLKLESISLPLPQRLRAVRPLRRMDFPSMTMLACEFLARVRPFGDPSLTCSFALRAVPHEDLHWLPRPKTMLNFAARGGQ
jgi:hypothetical protein